MATVVDHPRPRTVPLTSVTAPCESEVAGAIEPASPSVGHKTAMTIAVVLPPLGFITAIVLAWQVGWMSWLYLALLIGGWIATGTGITVGYHRLLSHRAFETFGWMRAFWTMVGAMAVQGSPLVWTAVHRKHHELSDQDGDPHSPRPNKKGWLPAIRAFVHSHTGWLFTHSWSTTNLERYVPDLMKDHRLVAIERTYLFWVLASLAIPAAIGGLLTMSWLGVLLGFLWGGLARVFFVHHITWSINSICHLFGRREYESGDDSRNNLICGILGHGEGWHNNHHAFPTSARHGLKWWQFDLSWLIIRSMQFAGLAWNVRTPNASVLESKRLSLSR